MSLAGAIVHNIFIPVFLCGSQLLLVFVPKGSWLLMESTEILSLTENTLLEENKMMSRTSE